MLLSPEKYSCALYCRLSSEDELQGESQSITNQRDLLERYTKENNLNIYDVYIDDGYSGTNFERPDFQRMLQDITDKKVNMVIVKDTSRLGRDYIEFGKYIEKFFPQNQIRVVCLLENYDSEIDNGVADTLPFKAVLNDLYARDTSKKVKATKKKNAQQGLYMGRFAPFGYDKSPSDKHKLIINEECAKTVRRIFELYLSGKSPLEISYILTNDSIPTPSEMMDMDKKNSVWHREVVTRILQNEMYIGNMVQCKKKKINYKLKKSIRQPKSEWIIIENTHEPIIDKESFLAVKEIMNHKNTTRTKTLNIMLRGLCVCKECGKKMGTTVDTRNKRTVYLRCSSYASAPKLHLCTPHTVNYSKLEDEIIVQVKKSCERYLKKNANRKSINIHMQDSDVDIKKEKFITTRSIQLLDAQIDSLYEDKLNGLLNENDFTRLYEKKNAERINKQTYLKELEGSSFYEKITNYEVAINNFLTSEKVDANALYTLIEKIEIDQEKHVKICYKFNELSTLS